MSLHEDSLSHLEMLIPEDEDPTDILELARRELGETRGKIACALKELTEMIQERGDVIPHRTDEAFLIRFLRAKHFDVQSSHDLMFSYYNFKKNNPNMCNGGNLTKASLYAICDHEVITVLPNRDQLSRRVTVYKLKKWNPNIVDVEEILKVSLLVLELSVLEQRTQIFGAVCLFDLEGLTLRQAMQITPKVANNIIQLMGEAFPIRVKEVHILNQPRIFDIIFGIFKPFLDERMRSKVHFHGRNYDSLHSFIEPKYLPEIYGGTRPHRPSKDLLENLMTFPIIIKELASLGYAVAADDKTTSQSKEDTT